MNCLSFYSNRRDLEKSPNDLEKTWKSPWIFTWTRGKNPVMMDGIRPIVDPLKVTIRHANIDLKWILRHLQFFVSVSRSAERSRRLINDSWWTWANSCHVEGTCPVWWEEIIPICKLTHYIYDIRKACTIYIFNTANSKVAAASSKVVWDTFAEF